VFVSRKFSDRRGAGVLLAQALTDYRAAEVVVVAIANGGAIVAGPVAESFGVSLELMILRNAVAPEFPGVVLGVSSARGSQIPNEHAIKDLKGLDAMALFCAMERAQREAEQMTEAMREVVAWPSVEGKMVLVIDDGAASAMTFRAAMADLRALHAQKIIVAAPVISCATREALALYSDGVISLFAPAEFERVGQFYEQFAPVDDTTVYALLARPCNSASVTSTDEAVSP
jgi:putative phosphoribosyl transferase